MSQLADKLTPIYAAIDDGQYEKAVRLCGRKDIERYDITKTLLAYSLQKLRQNTEALQIARQVLSRVTSSSKVDDAIVSTLAMTLSALRADDELRSMHEFLYEKDPSNEQAAINLFLCYTKLGESKKMQLHAQKIYKQTGSTRYVFWTVASMLSQLDGSSSAIGSTVLPLAERMLKKALEGSAEEKLKLGAQELELFVDILAQQGKIDEAIESLSSLQDRVSGSPIRDEDIFLEFPSSVQIHPLSLLELRINLFEKSGRKGDMRDGLMSMLSDYPDQWSAHSRVIDLIFSNSTAAGADPFDEEMLHRLVEHRLWLMDAQQSHPKLRGPWLAELYLVSTLGDRTTSNLEHCKLPAPWSEVVGPDDFTLTLDRSSASQLRDYFDGGLIFADIARLLCSYCARFSSKPCCFSDLKCYLEKIPVDSPALAAVYTWAIGRGETLLSSVGVLVTEMKGKSKSKAAVRAQDPSESRTQLVEMMYSLNTFLSISFFCAYLLRAKVSSGSSALTEQQLVMMYYLTKQLLNGGIGGDREVQPGDELLRFAVALLSETMTERVSLSLEAEVVTANLRLAHLFSVGAATSQHNYAFNLELLVPLRRIAVGELALAAFTRLDVKHIQLDSMSYLIIPAMLECGFFQEAYRHLQRVMQFHALAPREIGEMTAKCFQFNNYSKVIELRKFSEKCLNSYTLAIGKFEMTHLTLVQRCHNFVEAEKYMQEFTLGACPESCSFLADSEIFRLVDNSDYNILIPIDAKSHEICNAADVRRAELSYRLQVSQCVLKLLFGIVQKNTATTIENKDKLSSIRAIASGGQDQGQVKWSQRIDNGADSKYEDYIFRLLFLAVDLWLKYNESGSPIAEDILSSLEIQFIETIQGLTEFLYLTPSSEREKYLVSPSTEEALAASTASLVLEGGVLGTKSEVTRKSSVSPQWIKRMSYFTFTVGTWVPIVLGTILAGSPSSVSSAAKKGGKDKKKSKGAVAESASSEATTEAATDIFRFARSSSVAFSLLLKKCCDALKYVEAQGTKHITSNFDLVLSEVGFTQFDGRSNCESLNKARKELIAKVVSSYVTSCSNMFGILNSKRSAM